jgi:hypothetical protein
MASFAGEWPLTTVMMAYLILYFIVVNIQPAMAEYTAAIGAVIGIITWVRYHQRYRVAVRENDQYTRKGYKRVTVWMMFYLAAIFGIYFAYFSK